MKVQFYIRYKTSFGQSLWLSLNGKLGIDLIQDAIQMNYLNEEFWTVNLKIEKEKLSDLSYKYVLRNEDGEIIPEEGDDRNLEYNKDVKELSVIDTWNHAGEYENAFYTAPFTQVFLNHKSKKRGTKKNTKKYTHVLKVKAPLLKPNEAICLAGSSDTLSGWSGQNPVLLTKTGNWWVGHLDLSEERFPISYKYGVYDSVKEKLSRFESGNNRILNSDHSKNKLTIQHDGFIRLPNNTWKGTGIAIPVFSLRSKKGLGTGEFMDLKLLADWAVKTGLKMIQILPVNDTIATHTNQDSYPYAAISAFALHPLYLHLDAVASPGHRHLLKSLCKKKKQLNDLAEIDYQEVMKWKLGTLKEIFISGGSEDLKSDSFLKFFEKNRHWLVPYAAFSFLRDTHQTADYKLWPVHGKYRKKEIEKLTDKKSKDYQAISFYYYIQYHLHLQLKEAADYLHKKGIVLKGDIPIGIYRYGCDAWVDPDLYHMDWQAGAPPDDFAVKGQNWGFPTYNWEKMQEDHFDWWRRRFEQMSIYFDAFRIDHILGFFRIWSIPLHATDGVMGRFVPAIPVSKSEFIEAGIWFDQNRYCKPFINDEILNQLFKDDQPEVMQQFLEKGADGMYQMKKEINTQQKVEAYFRSLADDIAEKKFKDGLAGLISNVLLFEDEQGSDKYHFRIDMEKTSSFRFLSPDLQQKLKALYINYFYYRQDQYWQKEAMHKLPYLKRATRMLICGEDLGMVPHCVPDVMKQLGILSLEIQRMPKQQGLLFGHPGQAPYLSVVTPSTHDMSTIRGWWEEDSEKTRFFYYNILGCEGEVPFYCEPWINKAIVQQHLHSPAMWCIFQLQDILGISEKLRRQNPHDERINVPANPDHFWNYRMHLNMEDLKRENDFNQSLELMIRNSGRK